ncbi:MAG: L,D-transpeptidase [Hyphomicrobiaceae bacterium]
MLAGVADPAEAAKKKKKRKKASSSGQVEKVVTPKLPDGPINIVVSLGRQRITLYGSDMKAYATAPISSGRKGLDTPMGVFSILEKKKHHVSNLYNAEMPYMQRITWSGIAMHAGALPGYPASHGCIRLPYDFSRRLFQMTERGARVIVTRDDTAPTAFSHPTLFTYREKAAPVPADVAYAVLPPLARTAMVERNWHLTAIANHREDGPIGNDVLADPVPASAAAGEVPVVKASASTVASLDDAVPDTLATPFTMADIDGELGYERKGAITVFVSRKDKKVYVRQGGRTLFEAPASIADPSRPIGTHVITATALKAGGTEVDWMAVTVPSSYKKAKKADKYVTRKVKKNGKWVKVKVKVEDNSAPEVATGNASTAREALDRITLTPYAVNRISELLTTGSTVMISDNGISYETGKGTDIIVLTR